MSFATAFVRGPSRCRLSILVLAFLLAAPVLRAESLPLLLANSLAGHPTLAGRQFEAQAAQSGVEGARWQFSPTPSLSVELGKQAAILGTDRRSTVASLKQPLWTGGRLEAGMAAAEAQQRGADAALQEARRDIALEVIQAYSDAWGAQTRSASLALSLLAHNRLLTQVQRRADEGLAATSDVRLAQSRCAAVQAEQILAQAQHDSALRRLQTLAGRPLAGEPLVALAAREPLAAIDDDSHANDPTWQRLAAELEQLDAEVRRSRAQNLPELSARVDRRHGDVSGDNTLVYLMLESRWGAGLSNSTATHATLHRTSAKQSEISARRLRFAEQVQVDRTLLAAARARVAVQQAALEAAREVSESWERQFLAGKKSWQDVMNAAREVAQTEVQLSDAQGAVMTLTWRLTLLVAGVEAALDAGRSVPIEALGAAR